MAVFSGFELSEKEARFGFEELVFEQFPRVVAWSGGKAPANAANVDIMVVGAGISGIAAAIQFKRLGLRFRVFERNRDLGGTWWTNNYPDARVYTSSYLYQFKFEKIILGRNFSPRAMNRLPI